MHQPLSKDEEDNAAPHRRGNHTQARPIPRPEQLSTSVEHSSDDETYDQTHNRKMCSKVVQAQKDMLANIPLRDELDDYSDEYDEIEQFYRMQRNQNKNAHRKANNRVNTHRSTCTTRSRMADESSHSSDSNNERSYRARKQPYSPWKRGQRARDVNCDRRDCSPVYRKSDRQRE